MTPKNAKKFNDLCKILFEDVNDTATALDALTLAISVMEMFVVRLMPKENVPQFYGDLAKRLGENWDTVRSIMGDDKQDDGKGQDGAV